MCKFSWQLWLALGLAPLVFTGCTQNNVTENPSLGKYFDSAGVKGSFGLFDNAQGHFTIYNLPCYRDSSYPAGGSFDIVLSLVAIQTGAVKDSGSLVFAGDMPTGRGPASELFHGFYLAPMSLVETFRSKNADSASRALARRIGYDTVKKWVDSLQYGNRQIGNRTDFPDNTDLRVKPDEQLGLIKKLYFNQLPFFEHVQKSVRDMMLQESNANYQFHYKTAVGRTRDGHAFGWVLGWMEENKHPYFFVVNMEAADPQTDLAGAGVKIAKRILGEMGFFEGKK